MDYNRIKRSDVQKMMDMLEGYGACKLTVMEDGRVRVSGSNHRLILERNWMYTQNLEDAQLKYIVSDIGDECVVYKWKGELMVAWNL